VKVTGLGRGRAIPQQFRVRSWTSVNGLNEMCGSTRTTWHKQAPSPLFRVSPRYQRTCPQYMRLRKTVFPSVFSATCFVNTIDAISGTERTPPNPLVLVVYVFLRPSLPGFYFHTLMGRAIYRVNFFFPSRALHENRKAAACRSSFWKLTFRACRKSFVFLEFLQPGEMPNVAHVVGDTSYADIGLAG
jgi:hypothetical protein